MKNHEAWISVISHKRPENMEKLFSLIGSFTVYVNKGQAASYEEATKKNKLIKVRETNADEICSARNLAMADARKKGLICIQVSDDLKKIERIKMVDSKRVVSPLTFKEVVKEMITLMRRYRANYAGVAITSNRLNYVGKDIDLDKLIVNDLIGCIPCGSMEFDVKSSLKEDYDKCVQQLVYGISVLRLNNIICTFPHRENKGGANTYRNEKTELAPTQYLKRKWGSFIVDHKTRKGQIALNYRLIREASQQLANEKTK